MKLYQVVALGLGGVWLYGFLKHKQGVGSYSNALAAGCTVYNACGDTRPAQTPQAQAAAVVTPVIQSIAAVIPPAPPSLTPTKFSPMNCYGPAAPRKREMPAPSCCGVTNETSYFAPGSAVVAGEPEDVTTLQTVKPPAAAMTIDSLRIASPTPTKFSPQNCYGPAAPREIPAPAPVPVTLAIAPAPANIQPAPMVDNTPVSVPTGNCGYILQEEPISSKFRRMYDEL